MSDLDTREMRLRTLPELVNEDEPAIALLREWVAHAEVPCRILLPSARREQVLLGAQVTTRSPLGALAYETGGLLIDHGWLRILGSGGGPFQRDLASWNETRGKGLYLVADDALGGFFALNGGLLGPDKGNVYYWPPDSLEWEPLEIPFASLLQSMLSHRISKFYDGLRWPKWEDDASSLSPDACFSFYPFLWTAEGSLQNSYRAVVPVQEAYDLKCDIVRQISHGSA